jgi:hypothetical protein
MLDLDWGSYGAMLAILGIQNFRLNNKDNIITKSKDKKIFSVDRFFWKKLSYPAKTHTWYLSVHVW